jgi:putative ABC transport system permease protein
MEVATSSSSGATLLWRTSLRYLLRHPWQIGLCILGVALGVAMIVSIDLANASATQAFTLSTEAVAGRATHQVVGGPTGLDEQLYRRMRVDLGLRQSAPIVEGYVSVPALEGITMQLLGVDPLAEAPFRSYTTGAEAQDQNTDLTALLVTPNTALMSVQTARRYGIERGDTLELQIGSRQPAVRIIGLLNPNDALSRRALENLLITDIATAQEVLGQVGQLSRIDLILDTEQAATGADTTALAPEAVRAMLPPGAELTRPAARTNTLQQMTQAFELNLSALSLLALLVGIFLIYNTMTFGVVQRRALLGTLRCLGVTRRQVFRLILAEAAVISLIGSLIGMGLGILLARGLVVLVTRTINDLYFVVTVRELALDPLVLLKGGLLGVGATVIAALVPAREAMRVSPRMALSRSSIEAHIRRMVPRAAFLGLGLMALGGILLALPTFAISVLPTGVELTRVETPQAQVQTLALAFAGMFAILVGCALLTPGVTVGLMALARPLLGRMFGLLGRMAARDVVNALSRTSVAIAALMVAVSVTIGVGVMVDSFRQTVITWLDQSLVSDIYVSPPSRTSNRVDTTIDPAIATAFAQLPGIAGQTRFRNVQVETPVGPTTLVAIDRAAGRRGGQRFKQVSRDAAWDAFADGAIFISEPLAYRTGLRAGDRLRLRTDQGEQTFPIAGVYYDYTSDRGVIQMDYATYRAYWNDAQISSFGLYVEPGVDADVLVQELREQVGSQANLVINSNRTLRANTLAIFDRTFAITAVLRVLATIVAFIGILSALMALQLERARELGMLRANGLTPRQLWGVVLSQTSLMGLTAGMLAAPVGIILALVLIHVINRRSFGWTLELSLDPALFAQSLLVAVTAALLAGIYPALRMGRTSPAHALREE